MLFSTSTWKSRASSSFMFTVSFASARMSRILGASWPTQSREQLSKGERDILSREKMTDQEFIQMALEEARAGAQAGQVPIGAVLVYRDEVLARGGNRTIRDCDPTAHAEIVALREAARKLANYRLP